MPTTLSFSASQNCFFTKKLQSPSFQAKVASWYFFTFTFLEFFVHFFHLPRPGSHHQSLLHPDFSHIIQLLTWNLNLFSFSFWNIVVQHFGSEWPWSNRCPVCLDVIWLFTLVIKLFTLVKNLIISDFKPVFLVLGGLVTKSAFSKTNPDFLNKFFDT